MSTTRSMRQITDLTAGFTASPEAPRSWDQPHHGHKDSILIAVAFVIAVIGIGGVIAALIAS